MNVKRQGSPPNWSLVALIAQKVFPRHKDETTEVEVPELQAPAEYVEQVGETHEGVPKDAAMTPENPTPQDKLKVNASLT